MRALVVLLAAAAAAGCAASSETGGSATITRTRTETVGDVNDPFAKRAVAPRLWLRTRIATVRATKGSSCVEYTDPDSGEGASVCADTPFPTPQQLVVVRPGERVRFTMAGNHGFSIRVSRFGCERKQLQTLKTALDGRWRVSLRPGVYALLVQARFTLGRRKGDASGGLGLWVSRHKPRDVVPSASVYSPGC